MNREVTRHLAYLYFLDALRVRQPNPAHTCLCRDDDPLAARCLHDVFVPYFTEQDARLAMKRWGMTPEEMTAAALRSMPTEIQKLLITSEMNKRFDLYRVPGFYLHNKAWRINLPFRDGIIRPYRNGTDFIQGLLIYPQMEDAPDKAELLNSTGLMYGANPVPFIPQLETTA